MPDKKSRGVSNVPVKIQDVPDAPTVSASDVGTSRPYNNGAAIVTVTPTTGGLPTSYTVTSTPGSLTGTGTSPVTVTGLSSATSYTFTATATNAAATSPASSASGSITATTVPDAPTSISFTDGGTGTSGTLTWSAGATGGSTITGYTYSTDGVNYSAGTSPQSLTGLTPGDYTFYVKATNANGTSAVGTGSGTVIDPAATWLIARQTLSSDTASITFSSIPSNYKHLQLRIMAKDTVANSTVQSITMQFNSDTGSNYAYHRLEGSGSAASASGAATQTSVLISDCSIGNSSTSNIFGVSITDILDYTSTTKAKTVRALGGADKNAAGGYIALSSSLWTGTSAISTIKLTAGNTSFLTGSTFALYGMVG